MKLAMRIFVIILGIGIMVFSPKIAGYFAAKQDADKVDVVFPVHGYDLQITADERYEDVTEKGDFDLQLKESDAYISIYAFNPEDLSEGQTQKDLYYLQNQNLFSLRTDLKIIENESTENADKKTITRTLYQAKNMGAKNVYDCYLFEFEATDTFAWVLITTTPANYEVNGKYLRNVVYSLEPSTEESP